MVAASIAQTVLAGRFLKGLSGVNQAFGLPVATLFLGCLLIMCATAALTILHLALKAVLFVIDGVLAIVEAGPD